MNIVKDEFIGLIAGHSADSLTDELHNAGYKVALIGGNINEPGMDKADKVLVTELSKHNDIKCFLLDLKVNYIVIGTGHIKAFYLAEFLTNCGFLTNIDPAKSICAKNKLQFQKKLHALGIKIPNYIHFRNHHNLNYVLNNLGLPCVVKSATDATQPCKANTEQELEEAISIVKKTNTDIMIEQFIDGSDLTVAVINDDGIASPLDITYYSKAKEYRLKGFDSAYTEKQSEETEAKIYKIAKSIVENLGYYGIVRIDFMVQNNDIYVLELNSVLVTGYNGSAYPFFLKQGINIAKLFIQTALNIYKLKNEK